MLFLPHTVWGTVSTTWLHKEPFQPDETKTHPSLRCVSHAFGDADLQAFQQSYDKVIKHDFERRQTAGRTHLKLAKFSAPKNPIVLCHGLSGFDRLIILPSVGHLTRILTSHSKSSNSEQFLEEESENSRLKGLLEVEYWFGVQQALEAKGCTVISAKVPGFASIEERARTLNDCIERETRSLRISKNEDAIYNTEENVSSSKTRDPIKVNLIAHSMGGLDCRFLISNIPNKNFEVVTLTTVSTPHRGSEMADFVVELSKNVQKKLAVGEPTRILPLAIYQLTTKNMESFNKKTQDDPGVKYMSYGASMCPKWYNIFNTSWHIVFKRSNGVPNDGLVSVESSKWGEYMGTIKNADHLDIINWKNKLQKDISNVFAPKREIEQKLEPDVDMLEFYLGVANNLAKKGF
ncbi:LADA_0H02718g1_1 [Lachancea dasiensis]|uniref:GPI inositol-deacylase n=1 Tax=Lachancea dasiensis TaxID=1072105 RepID=A0A1G4JZY2_9SACH|nr:LADA_0H02718g1_1 [Lachancea dasiensis]